MDTQSEASLSAKQEEEILVEKDGRFELVKVEDMQATKESPKQVSETKEGAVDIELNAVCSNNNAETSNMEIDTSKSTVKFTVEATQSPPLAPQDLMNTHTLTTASVSLLTHTSKPKHPSSRTKSAPGVRQSNQDESRKKEQSEAAFRAWLSKKDRQLSQQRRTELSKKETDEEQREKQRRNEVAYKAWLECKKQEYLEQRAKEKALRPITSISRDEEARKRAAFENWLSVKQQEKQKENDSKQKIRQQEEMSAKKADPSLVSEAYKKYAQ